MLCCTVHPLSCQYSTSTHRHGTTTQPSRLDIIQLEEDVCEFFECGLAPSTVRTYQSAEETLSMFTVFLARQGLKYQSVKGYILALRHLQIAEASAWRPIFAGGLFSVGVCILKGVKHTPSAQAPYYPGYPETLTGVMVEASTQPRYSDAVDSMLSGIFWFFCALENLQPHRFMSLTVRQCLPQQTCQ